MKKKIYPFQYIGVKRAYEEGRFLIADDMGMFKTAQSILLNNKIRQSNRKKTRTLVVCPTSVREHWAREISDWAYPRSPDVVVLTTQNYSAEYLKAKDSDWVVTHYHLFSSLDEQTLKKFYRIGFDHVILDEVHNAKNPEAIRTQGVLKVTNNLEHLTLLSGTPIPNTVEDAYMLMHLLEPKNYPLSDNGNINSAAQHWFKELYWQNPQAFKELIHRKMIRRMAREYMPGKLPEVVEKNIYIDIEGPWLDIYDSILQQDLPLGRKLMQLEKTQVDTSIVDPSFIRGISTISPKYDALDDIVANETKKGKVLIFTNLKEGVVDSLVDRYGRWGAIAITGDIPSYGGGQREQLRQQFQHDPNTQVLVATTTMHEGVDLTAATAIVNLMLPWTPAEKQQRIKRSDRWGEIEKESLTIYNILGRYLRRIRQSLDEARYDMLEGKQRVVDFLYSGHQLSREQLSDFQNPNKVPRIRKALASNNQIIFKYFLSWRGIGTQKALKRLKKRPELDEQTAGMYARFSMARNAAEIYIPVIQKLSPEEPWLDIAGGPGMLGYYAEKPVHVLDISHSYLKEGRKLNTGEHVQGSFSSLPYIDGRFGLAVCSLAFQMSEPTQERAQVLQEMNRALKDGGYGIITLPTRYTVGSDRQKFNSVLSTYGFESINEFHGLDLGLSKLELYVIKKIGTSGSRICDLTFEGDRVMRR